MAMPVILLVEADRDLGDLLAFAFQERGYRVVWASAGANAFHWIEANRTPPNVMVVDLMLSGWDESEVVASARGQWGDAFPIVLIKTEDHAGRAAEQLDVKQTLAKPFELAALVRLVELHIWAHESDRIRTSTTPTLQSRSTS